MAATCLKLKDAVFYRFNRGSMLSSPFLTIEVV